MPLTVLQVQNAKPNGKPYKMADDDGLYLYIKPDGGKYWRYNYVFQGKAKTYSYGTTKNISLSEARDIHRDVRKQLRDKVDPGAAKQNAKREAMYNASNTFKVVAQEWLDTKKAGWRSPRHYQKFSRWLELHVYPDIGNTPISSIKPLEFYRFIKKLEDKSTAEVTHKVFQLCNSVFIYAVMTQRRIDNPVASIARGGVLKPRVVRHYPYLRSHELPEFFEKLENVNAHPQIKIAMKFAMLTMVRQGELRKAKWEHINWQEKTWYIPPENIKKGEQHIVPLSSQALALLEELKKFSWGNPHELLFPSCNRQKNPGMSENTFNTIIERMGMKGRIVGHGFRATASTHLNELGRFRHDVIERQLAHKPKDQVRASYNHAEYMPERWELINYWGNYLESQMVKQSNVIQGHFIKVS